MNAKTIAPGIVHDIPDDLRELLLNNDVVLEKWNNLTDLARNEWICYVTIVKKAETRANHLVRLSEELLMGEKRPCCWPGCPHRRESAKKWFKNLK
jgi:uncharacterized protein YdeI (YjbR/CyaY-like superfamily)